MTRPWQVEKWQSLSYASSLFEDKKARSGIHRCWKVAHARADKMLQTYCAVALDGGTAVFVEFAVWIPQNMFFFPPELLSIERWGRLQQVRYFSLCSPPLCASRGVLWDDKSAFPWYPAKTCFERWLLWISLNLELLGRQVLVKKSSNSKFSRSAFMMRWAHPLLPKLKIWGYFDIKKNSGNFDFQPPVSNAGSVYLRFCSHFFLTLGIFHSTESMAGGWSLVVDLPVKACCCKSAVDSGRSAPVYVSMRWKIKKSSSLVCHRNRQRQSPENVGVW